MVLVDTSVWVDHLRKGHDELVSLLTNAQVACHPFIIGELACGGLRNRNEILSLLKALPPTIGAQDEEVLEFINAHELMNRGIGYIDVHLLTSAMLTGIPVWTFDKKLHEISAEFDVDYKNERHS